MGFLPLAAGAAARALPTIAGAVGSTLLPWLFESMRSGKSPEEVQAAIKPHYDQLIKQGMTPAQAHAALTDEMKAAAQPEQHPMIDLALAGLGGVAGYKMAGKYFVPKGPFPAGTPSSQAKNVAPGDSEILPQGAKNPEQDLAKTWTAQQPEAMQQAGMPGVDKRTFAPGVQERGLTNPAQMSGDFTMPPPDGGTMPMSHEEIAQYQNMLAARRAPRQPPQMPASPFPRLGYGGTGNPQTGFSGVDIEH